MKLIEGEEYLCFDGTEQSELIGQLAGCVEMKKQYEECVKNVSPKTPIWEYVILGVILGGVGVGTVGLLK